jgi:NADH dehydrogenase [ubiquinone] 1 alpha subcomplex assembly factor 7
MLIPALLRGAPEGSIFELSPVSTSIAAAFARCIAANGLAALVIDYGRAASALGPSLQAVRAHRMADVLAEPGQADLSAHVDFAMIGRAAREQGAAIFGPATQGEFLGRMGLELRAARLKASASADQARALDAAADRLTGPAAMGDLFKALAITKPGLSPAGFAAENGGYA